MVQGQEIAAVNNRRMSGDAESQHAVSGNLPPLELGQEIDALVIDELDDGRLLLKIGASLIEADNPGGLGAGQRVHLRVDQLQPTVVLHVTDVEPTVLAEAARLLRSHLPAHADAGQLLNSLQTELTAVINSGVEPAPLPEVFTALREAITDFLPTGMSLTAEKLERLARDGGLFYETKLANAASDPQRLHEIADQDLKGLLLAAAHELRARASSASLQQALGALLDNLETQQAVNALAQLDGRAFQLQIPFFNGAGFSTAALAVEHDSYRAAGKQDQAEAGYTVLILLDLENFGRTRVDAHADSAKVHAVFYVDREGSLLAIRQGLPAFRQALLSLGYHDILLAAKLLREMPQDKQAQFAALAVGAPPSIHLLDLKA